MHRYSDKERAFSGEARIDSPDIMDRIRSVEGPQWYRGESEPKDVNSGKGALEAWRDWCAKWEERRSEDPEWADENLSRKGSTMIVIYGNGGRNRYYVRGDGTVVFSESHCVRKDDLRKATEAGFPIF